jgi:hypothetical protein
VAALGAVNIVLGRLVAWRLVSRRQDSAQRSNVGGISTSPADAVLLLGAGVLAGAVGSAGGITSLISYPALLAVGIPALPANVTNAVALVTSWARLRVGLPPGTAGPGIMAPALGPADCGGRGGRCCVVTVHSRRGLRSSRAVLAGLRLARLAPPTKGLCVAGEPSRSRQPVHAALRTARGVGLRRLLRCWVGGDGPRLAVADRRPAPGAGQRSKEHAPRCSDPSTGWGS